MMAVRLVRCEEEAAVEREVGIGLVIVAREPLMRVIIVVKDSAEVGAVMVDDG